MMKCKKCDGEIAPWYAPEVWSGEVREINHEESGLCNSCFLGVDGVLEIIDIDEMYKWGETLPPPTFRDYLNTIPGIIRLPSAPIIIFVEPKTRREGIAKKWRQFKRLLLSRNLRQRLKRYQIARGRYLWGEGASIADGFFVNSTLSAEEILEIYREWISDEGNGE